MDFEIFDCSINVDHHTRCKNGIVDFSALSYILKISDFILSGYQNNIQKISIIHATGESS